MEVSYQKYLSRRGNKDITVKRRRITIKKRLFDFNQEEMSAQKCKKAIVRSWENKKHASKNKCALPNLEGFVFKFMIIVAPFCSETENAIIRIVNA